ncbi:MAG: hypothetical protein WKF76_01115 [Nocardioidaceae bacterium]
MATSMSFGEVEAGRSKPIESSSSTLSSVAIATNAASTPDNVRSWVLICIRPTESR